MAVTSYPNVTLNTTLAVNSSGAVTIDGRHDRVIFTSTLGSSVNLVIASNAPAGLRFWAIQFAGGKIGVTAGSGATANNVSGATGTSGQYAVMSVYLVTDGNAVFTGDVS